MSTSAAPVETKVIAATVVTLALSVTAAMLNAVQANPDLLGDLPTWAQTVLILLVPPLLTFIAGYHAPHTNRGGS